ncbi:MULTISPECIES: hypothetical protein [Streptomyces]|uniref:hypothetical protein n=1 Tax=Streptomyces TaxID=1883 RepID=UPI0013E3F618|nr:MULTISPECIES: hypothetical protein [Streptomyces]
MNDRAWLALVGVTTAEGLVFQLDPEQGWPFVMAVLVAAIQEFVRGGRDDS